MISLKLIITPNNYKNKYDGALYSTESKINVNKIDNVYIILFSDYDFKKKSPSVTLNNIKEIISSNLKDCEVVFSIDYEGNNLDQTTLLGLLKVDDDLSADPKILYPLIYNSSDNLIMTAQKLLSENSKSSENEVKNINMMNRFLEDFDEDDEEEDVDDEDIEDIMSSLYGFSPSKKKKKYKNNFKYKRKKISYNSSRVLKAASNPRKSFNRHGIIICNNKKAIRKDEEIIKDFLKDFIPGNSKFKKKFRKELLKRWVSLYVISKKKANKMKKYYNKSTSNAIKQQKAEQVIDFTRKMLSVPINNWNDPNK